MAIPLRHERFAKPTSPVVSPFRRQQLAVVPGRRRVARFAIGLTVLISVVMMGAVFLHTRIAERQLEIDQLERSVRQAQEDFDVLRAQRAELRSLPRLSTEAEALGMYPAAEGEFLRVDPMVLAVTIARTGETPARRRDRAGFERPTRAARSVPARQSGQRRSPMSRRTPPSPPARRTAPKVKRAATSRSASGRSTRSSGSSRSGTARSGSARSGSARSGSARSGSARSGSARRATTSGSSRRQAPQRQRREVTVREPSPTQSRTHRRQSRRTPRRRVLARSHVIRPRRDFLGLGKSSARLKLLLVFLLVVLGSVLFKVAQIQSAGGAALRSAGDAQWSRTTPLAADRGTVFDRDGEELALSVPSYSISVNPKLVTDEAGTARLMQSFLGLDDTETARPLRRTARQAARLRVRAPSGRPRDR